MATRAGPHVVAPESHAREIERARSLLGSSAGSRTRPMTLSSRDLGGRAEQPSWACLPFGMLGPVGGSDVYASMGARLRRVALTRMPVADGEGGQDGRACATVCALRNLGLEADLTERE